jgi:AcrR family transcriptional regulator
MTRRPNSRDDILSAAEAIVCELGSAHLTLDAVAERAEISKGGLLYNYPSKEALLRAMLARLLDRCEADCAAARAAAETGAPDPAADLKAYIEVGFRQADDRRQLSAALLAAGANDPRLLSPVRDWHRRHLREFSADKRNPLRVLLVMLAMDGLWLNELLQTSAVDPEHRDRLRRELMALAESAV